MRKNIGALLVLAWVVIVPVAAWAAWQYKTGLDLQRSIEACSSPGGTALPGFTLQETRRMCVDAEMHALGH